jgi:hypothetical protein
LDKIKFRLKFLFLSLTNDLSLKNHQEMTMSSIYLPRIQTSPDGHYLMTAQGEPFFWLGDTAWELYHRLNREEIERYLENRRQKGFNVIQAVALAELDGLRVPNP